MTNNINNKKSIIIVGGGIIGCLTAWELHKRGVKPIIIERGKFGREASWAGAGILCPIYPWLYPDAFSQLVTDGLAMMKDCCAELEHVSGISTEMLSSGMIIPLIDDDDLQHAKQAKIWARRFAWQVEEIDAAHCRQLEPAMSDKLKGALYWSNVAQIRNPRLLHAVQSCLQQAQVDMREDVSVEGLIENANGNVTGVRCADGTRIAADAVLLAAGSWSGRVAQSWGVNLPVAPVKGQIVLLHSKPGRIRHIIKHKKLYLVPRNDGRLLVGATMESSGFKRGNTVAAVHSLLDEMLQLTPALADADIEQQWTGFRPGSPDGLPFLGPVQSKSGLWVASGHYRNGVLLAPITANIMADWMLGKAPKQDVQAFAVERDCGNNDKVLGYPSGT
ncbi:MAG: glycine oxidase ThiO [Mariprofundales bacterium]